ncbi:MAG: helix-turn-helix domain-containing protein, partial [Gammaproteobacteria bacterium]
GPVVGELKDSSASLDALWGQQAQDLREQVLEASTSAQRVRIVERHLLARLRRTRSIHPAVGHALGAFKDGRVSVSSVTNESNLNPRRFIELFRREVGMTPKVFCRIARFKRALAAVDAELDADWTDIALRCGYYDQSHFNHDFREFAGVTPSAYLAGRTSRHHVRVAQ